MADLPSRISCRFPPLVFWQPDVAKPSLSSADHLGNMNGNVGIYPPRGHICHRNKNNTGAEDIIILGKPLQLQNSPIETMLIRLLPVVLAQAPPPRSAPTDIEVMLKRLLPGTPTRAPQPRPVTVRRDCSVTVVAFPR